jgi:hypothetical protein
MAGFARISAASNTEASRLSTASRFRAASMMCRTSITTLSSSGGRSLYLEDATLTPLDHSSELLKKGAMADEARH